MAIGRTNAMVTSTTPSTTDPYKGQRPSNWLAIKMPSKMKEEKPNNFQCEILVELTDYGLSNICFSYKGNYTIDWGDENTENVSFTQATSTQSIGVVEHYYNYDNITNSLTTNSKQVLIKVVAADNDTTEDKTFGISLNDSNIYVPNKSDYGRSDNTVEPYLEVSCYCPTTYVARINYSGDYCYNRLKFISAAQDVAPNFYFPGLSGLMIKGQNLSALIGIPELSHVNFGVPTYYEATDSWGFIRSFQNMKCFSSDLGNYILNSLSLENSRSFLQTFQECGSLSKLPSSLNFAKTININYAFDGCIGISDFHTSTFTTVLQQMNYAFRNSGIKVCNDLETSNVTTMIEAFKYCRALTRLSISLNSITSDSAIKDFVKGCYSLTHLTLTKTGGIDVALDLSDCTLLSANYLEALFNNLATITTAKTLTLGATLLAKLSDTQKAIATNKGWTLA